MNQALDAQAQAKQVRSSVQRVDITVLPRDLMDQGDQAYATAEQQLQERKFAEARANYDQARDAYGRANLMAMQMAQVRPKVENGRYQLDRARQVAYEAGAEEWSVELWNEAEQLRKELEDSIAAQDYATALNRLELGAKKYADAAQLAQHTKVADARRKQFAAELTDPGESLFDQYGGARWDEARTKIRESELAGDPRQISQRYQEALALIPDIREVIPEPVAPTTRYQMDLAGAGDARLPTGWGAVANGLPSLASIKDVDGLRVLGSQRTDQEQVLELPGINLQGDFFLQVDTRFPSGYNGVGITLVGTGVGKDLDLGMDRVRGAVRLNLTGAADREVKMNDIRTKNKQLSFRIERRGNTYELWCTSNRSESVRLQVAKPGRFQGVRIVFKNTMCVRGMRFGPLDPPMTVVGTANTFSLDFPLWQPSDPRVMISQSSAENRQARISPLSLEGAFSLEFSVKSRNGVFQLNLVGRGDGEDYPLFFEAVGSTAIWFPHGGYERLTNVNASSPIRFRLERRPEYCRVLINDQEVGGKLACSGLASFEAIEFETFQGDIDISSLRINPL